MGNTNEDLKAAFAGESQANRRYLFFAEKADEAGNKQIARLFRAAAEAETVHARNHIDVLGGIGAVKENLQAAIAGENHEFTVMYPAFIKQARAENNSSAERTFDLANKVEKIHHGLFQKALRGLESAEPPGDKPYFVCHVCGNTVPGEVPEKCPVCGAGSKAFKKVE